jgi:hypothetical protein
MASQTDEQGLIPDAGAGAGRGGRATGRVRPPTPSSVAGHGHTRRPVPFGASREAAVWLHHVGREDRPGIEGRRLAARRGAARRSALVQMMGNGWASLDG